VVELRGLPSADDGVFQRLLLGQRHREEPGRHNALGTITTSLAVVSALKGPVETAEADFTSTDNNMGPRFGIVLRYQDSKNYYLIHRRTGGQTLDSRLLTLDCFP
jgi:hypothetical protein